MISITKKHNYMTKEQVRDQGMKNAVLYRNYASTAMSGTCLWWFLSSPDDLLRSPYEVGGRGVERLRKLRDLVDLDVAFCGEYAHESAYGYAGRFG